MARFQAPMSVAEAAAFVRSERLKRGWTAQDLADRLMDVAMSAGDELSLTQQAISFFETGKAKSIPRWLRHFELVLLDHDISVRPGNIISSDSDDDTVEITKVDLALGMGATFLDDDFIPVEKVQISQSILRIYTDSPPEMLALARGVGDSMSPTIMDGETILIVLICAEN